MKKPNMVLLMQPASQIGPELTYREAREALATGTASPELVATHHALVDLFLNACQSAKVYQDLLSDPGQNVER